MKYKELSKQRRWQLIRLIQGLCQRCGKLSNCRSECDSCAKKHGICKRHSTPATWDAVDWSQSNNEIASRLGVTSFAVRYQRNKRNL
jgi:hypothetical protein